MVSEGAGITLNLAAVSVSVIFFFFIDDFNATCATYQLMGNEHFKHIELRLS
jgi:hypothetical protein